MGISNIYGQKAQPFVLELKNPVVVRRTLRVIRGKLDARALVCTCRLEFNNLVTERLTGADALCRHGVRGTISM
jgi:hypothetical protein